MKLRNKKIIDILFILLLFGVLGVSVTEDYYNKLEEQKSSSSNSSFYKKKIDNYDNVMNYRYLTKTSTTSNCKNLHLKNMEFSFWEEIDIPGMPATNNKNTLNEFVFGTSQCPQGICLTKDFVFITSYSDDEGYLGQFMVFDKYTGEYLITLGMDKNSHLGGIACDGENVWVCNSNNKTIERISYDFIYLMATRNKGKMIDATQLVDNYKVKNVPSCITFYNGRLWIATHNIWFNSHMVAYYYDKNEDKLKVLSTYNIPPQVQGVAFSDKGEVYLSISYGRRYSSYIKQYESIFSMTKNVDKATKVIEMPPCSEEISIYEDILYVLFESAGEKYLEGTDGDGISLAPLDKILMIPIKNAGD